MFYIYFTAFLRQFQPFRHNINNFDVYSYIHWLWINGPTLKYGGCPKARLNSRFNHCISI
jgi:hypothetical protein